MQHDFRLLFQMTALRVSDSDWITKDFLHILEFIDEVERIEIINRPNDFVHSKHLPLREDKPQTKWFEEMEKVKFLTPRIGRIAEK